MSDRSIKLLLSDILESIHNIREFTKGMNFEQYESDLKTRYAVERNFIIIGEATARISNEFKELHIQIDWRQLKDFRNVITHNYFGIDNTIVWNIIEYYLTELEKEINILNSHS